MSRQTGSAGVHRLTAICAITMSLSCNMEGAPSAVNVRDSAGITIREMVTESPMPLRLTRRPLVSVAPEVPGVYAVYRVRDIVRLSDGSLVVSNGGTELLFFDETGQYRHTVGQRGGGPGEFEDINSVHQGPGDSLYVYDARLDRLTVMDRDGSMGSMTHIEHPDRGSLVDVVGVLSNGSVVLIDASHTTSPPVSGPVSLPFGVYLYDRARDAVAVVGGYERAPAYRYVVGNRSTTRTIPFRVSPTLAVHDNALFIGDGNTPDVQLQASPGEPGTFLRLLREPIPVTAADIERYRERRLDDTRSEARRRTEREILDLMTFPGEWSFYQDMEVGTDGMVWLREVGPGLEDRLQRWIGFDPNGRRTRTFEIEGDFELVEIGSQTVVGILRDDFDVEHVVIHGLQRAPADGPP